MIKLSVERVFSSGLKNSSNLKNFDSVLKLCIFLLYLVKSTESYDALQTAAASCSIS